MHTKKTNSIMKTLQGKVKSIQVTKEQVTEGMQICWLSSLGWNTSTIKEIRGNVYWVVWKGAPLNILPVDFDMTKTLVIEYLEEIVGSPKFDHYYFNTYDNQYWKYRPSPCPLPYWSNISTLRDVKQLPLKYSDWQLAIDNGEVDSDKVVEFEVMDYGNKQYGYPIYAKIIPQKKRMYSEEQVIGIINYMESRRQYFCEKGLIDDAERKLQYYNNESKS